MTFFNPDTFPTGRRTHVLGKNKETEKKGKKEKGKKRKKRKKGKDEKIGWE